MQILKSRGPVFITIKCQIGKKAVGQDPRGRLNDVISEHSWSDFFLLGTGKEVFLDPNQGKLRGD